MKVVPFDEVKAVSHGTVAPYGRAAAVFVLAELSDASLRGLFNFGK
jgi:hypothetical protein